MLVTDQKHIIKRQVIELGLTSSENAFQIQDDVSRNFKNVIIPLLEEVFDEISSPEEVLKIDTLRLDLGSINLNELSTQLSTKVREKLSEVLVPEIESKRNGTKLPSQVEKRFLENEEPVIGLHIKSKELSEIEKIVHFLKTGTLPWWGNKGDYFSLEKSIQKLLREDPKSLIDFLKEYTVYRNYQNRLINNCTDIRLLNLLQQINPKTKVLITKAALFIQALKKKNQLDSTTRQEIWNYTFDLAIKENIQNQEIENEEVFFELLIVLQNENGVGRRSIAKMVSKGKGIKANVLKTLIREAVPQQNRTPIHKLLAVLKKNKGLKDESWKQLIKEAVSNNIVVAPKETFIEEIYIENAGLIICWNYMSIFFKEFKLVVNKEFVNEEAAQRAVHLLQYMATKEENVAEHELALNKILCGLPVDNPISIDFKLTEKEKDECENLLQAVLDNWKVLKNTSPQSLRETFLIKEGVLTKIDNEWHLRLERTAVDMLIDKLPWNISMINLPWNDHIIHVNW